MNNQAKGMPGSSANPQTGPMVISPARIMYWSLRRELWENPFIYLAPLIAALVFLFGFLINTLISRSHRQGIWSLSPEQQHKVSTVTFEIVPYEAAAALIMGAAFLVGVFYSLDALYGERRDRSILFWKSLPVSDLTTVLSKLAIPLVVLPLLSFAITVATQLVMLLLGSMLMLGSGVSISLLWAHAPVLHFSWALLYHIVTVHGLWYAPMYGWLFLVSAWAPRAPFIWAFLPPLLICGVEKLAFNTTYFLSMLERRLTGPVLSPAPPATTMMDMLAVPSQFFITPGLWIGLAIAAACFYAAVRLRRYRGPI